MANRIMEKCNIYIIRSKNIPKIILGKYAFLDHKKASIYLYENYDYTSACVDMCRVPFVGKHVHYLRLYRGFDYYMDGMHNNCWESCEIYPSIELAKESNIWKSILKTAKNSPDEYNIHNDKICSKDSFGDDWFYGDVMEDKLNLEIMKLKVVR